MRRVQSALLMALAWGLWAVDRPAEAATYAGAASTRICPVTEECAGHVQYQMQQQTVLRTLQETVYVPKQVTTMQTVNETVMQPRTVTTMQTVTECGVQEVPYTVQRPCYRTEMRECRYTV